MASLTKQVGQSFAVHTSRPTAGVQLRSAAFRPARASCMSQSRRVSLLSTPAQASRGMQMVAAAAAAAAQTATPATLPGTPQSFPIPEDKLIQLAKDLWKAESGIADDSLLAPDFRFEFPVVSLSRSAYLKAVSSFDLKSAFPDMDPHPYHWRVDPYEPNRVWFTTRVTATHTGTLNFGGKKYPGTGKTVQGAPECLSYVFNEEGKCTSYTGAYMMEGREHLYKTLGYIMDRRVGNTNKMGALFGILSAIGVWVPEPGSLSFKLLNSFNWLRQKIAGIFSGGKKD